MKRTAIQLGGVELGSSIMNASGPRSAERDEIVELGAAHAGALVFKSCNSAGLDAPDNLKNRGVEHFAALARELTPGGKKIIGSVVGTTADEIVKVAAALGRAGASIVELNFADPYVLESVAPWASLEKLKSIVGRVRGESGCAIAVKLPPGQGGHEPRAIADLLKSLGVAVAVCANDLPKDLEIEIASGRISGRRRALSQVNSFYREGDGQLEVVAVGGINNGRDAYIAHLTGAKALQVGSALIKEGAGALERIDRELDALLAQNSRASVNDIIGRASFAQ